MNQTRKSNLRVLQKKSQSVPTYEHVNVILFRDHGMRPLKEANVLVTRPRPCNTRTCRLTTDALLSSQRRTNGRWGKDLVTLRRTSCSLKHPPAWPTGCSVAYLRSPEIQIQVPAEIPMRLFFISRCHQGCVHSHRWHSHDWATWGEPNKNTVQVLLEFLTRNDLIHPDLGCTANSLRRVVADLIFTFDWFSVLFLSYFPHYPNPHSSVFSCFIKSYLSFFPALHYLRFTLPFSW